MTAMRYAFLSAAASVLLAQAEVANAQQMVWLSPEATRDAPYTFLTAAGQNVTLPSDAYKGWSVFNAFKETLEAPQDYAVSSETDADNVGAGMLRFAGQIEDENTYLALGISETSGAVQVPVRMDSELGKVRIYSVYSRVRFVECAEAPAMSELQEMYPTYADSVPNGEADPVFTAAKLGLCVLEDGYFHVSCVRAGSAIDPGTGFPEDYTYTFEQSDVAYADVGGGEVVVRIEFNVYENADGDFRRAYRIFVARADGTGEVCITKGLGYPWMIENGVYQFDFTRLGEGEWLYAIDDAYAAGGGLNGTNGIAMADAPIDTLNHLAFSATDGGFYGAWMEKKSADDVVTLAAYDASLFTPFVREPGALFDLYADWATAYNVTLSEWLPQKAEGVALYAAEPDALTQHAFDAFLLYMDPETEEPLRLTVTGIVPEADTISFTVVGPEGANLREAVARAARLRIRRAADLAALATAEATEYDVEFSADGTAAVFALPKIENEEELPFLQATLVPVTDGE